MECLLRAREVLIQAVLVRIGSMTDNPIIPAGLRGAIDLSSLAHPAASTRLPTSSGGGAVASAGDNVVIEVDDVSFGDAVQTSTRVPVILAVYSGNDTQSRQHVDTLAAKVRSYTGKLQLATVNIDVAMQIRQALQVQQVPMVLAILQGQPLPLYVGNQPDDAIKQVMDKVLKAAVANGITGRLEGAADTDDEDTDTAPDDSELTETHQRAVDAIDREDYVSAVVAYDEILATNPQDDEAKLGLGQVKLLQRTEGVDLTQACDAAAAAPTDVAKQTIVADFDLLGGHVKEAFSRLINLVTVTSGDERDVAREHLIELFDVIGTADPRVKKARIALMSVLH